MSYECGCTERADSAFSDMELRHLFDESRICLLRNLLVADSETDFFDKGIRRISVFFEKREMALTEEGEKRREFLAFAGVLFFPPIKSFILVRGVLRFPPSRRLGTHPILARPTPNSRANNKPKFNMNSF